MSSARSCRSGGSRIRCRRLFCQKAAFFLTVRISCRARSSFHLRGPWPLQRTPTRPRVLCFELADRFEAGQTRHLYRSRKGSGRSRLDARSVCSKDRGGIRGESPFYGPQSATNKKADGVMTTDARPHARRVHSEPKTYGACNPPK